MMSRKLSLPRLRIVIDQVLQKFPKVPETFGRRLRALPLLLMRALVAIFGLYYVWTFADLTLDRIVYPGELEWMEGGVLGHVLRVLDGKSLYAEPDLEFTPYIYPPLYYWVCALLSSIFGPSLSLLRTVSSASFFGSLLVIVGWSYRQNRSIVSGLIGSGLFAATFRLGGAWFDIARTDSFLVFLMLVAGFLLFTFKTRATAIASGLVFCLAFLTKQSALLPLCAVGGWAIFTGERRMLWFAGVTFGCSFLSWLALHFSTGGWFSYYLFQVPSAHPLLDEWKLLFWQRDVLGVLAIPSFILLYEVGRCALERRFRWGSLGFPAFSTGIVLLVWSSRFHLGMYDNVLMPLHALLGLATALALGHLQEQKAEFRALEVAVLVGVAGSLWNLEYPVEAQRPSPAHLAQHRALMQRFSTSPKGAWAPYHTAPTVLAGNPPRSHIMALVDIFRGDPEQGERLAQQAEMALKEHRYPAIFWSRNDQSTEFFRAPLAKYYRRAGPVRGPAPLTGWGQYVTELWVPRRPATTRSTPP